MPTTLSTKAVEGSTFVITAAFTDEDGVTAAPSSITWTLTDAAGNVINSREDVAVATPASSIDIVLSGNDLPGVNAAENELRLVIEAVYSSDAGSDLPLVDEVAFRVASLPGIS